MILFIFSRVAAIKNRLYLLYQTARKACPGGDEMAVEHIALHT